MHLSFAPLFYTYFHYFKNGFDDYFEDYFSMQWHCFSFYKIKKDYYKTFHTYRIPEYVRELFFANFMLKTKEKQHSYRNRLLFFSHVNTEKVHVHMSTPDVAL